MVQFTIDLHQLESKATAEVAALVLHAGWGDARISGLSVRDHLRLTVIASVTSDAADLSRQRHGIDTAVRYAARNAYQELLVADLRDVNGPRLKSAESEARQRCIVLLRSARFGDARAADGSRQRGEPAFSIYAELLGERFPGDTGERRRAAASLLGAMWDIVRRMVQDPAEPSSLREPTRLLIYLQMAADTIVRDAIADLRHHLQPSSLHLPLGDAGNGESDRIALEDRVPAPGPDTVEAVELHQLRASIMQSLLQDHQQLGGPAGSLLAFLMEGDLGGGQKRIPIFPGIPVHQGKQQNMAEAMRAMRDDPRLLEQFLTAPEYELELNGELLNDYLAYLQPWLATQSVDELTARQMANFTERDWHFPKGRVAALHAVVGTPPWNGRMVWLEPVATWVAGLTEAKRKRFLHAAELLEYHGPNLGVPRSRVVRAEPPIRVLRSLFHQADYNARIDFRVLYVLQTNEATLLIGAHRPWTDPDAYADAKKHWEDWIETVIDHAINLANDHRPAHTGVS